MRDIPQHDIEFVNRPGQEDLELANNRGYTIDTDFTPTAVDAPPTSSVTPAEHSASDTGSAAAEE